MSQRITEYMTVKTHEHISYIPTIESLPPTKIFAQGKHFNILMHSHEYHFYLHTECSKSIQAHICTICLYVHTYAKIVNALFHTSKSLENNVRAKQCTRGIVSATIEVDINMYRCTRTYAD